MHKRTIFFFQISNLDTQDWKIMSSLFDVCVYIWKAYY